MFRQRFENISERRAATEVACELLETCSSFLHKEVDFQGAKMPRSIHNERMREEVSPHNISIDNRAAKALKGALHTGFYKHRTVFNKAAFYPNALRMGTTISIQRNNRS